MDSVSITCESLLPFSIIVTQKVKRYAIAIMLHERKNTAPGTLDLVAWKQEARLFCWSHFFQTFQFEERYLK